MIFQTSHAELMQKMILKRKIQTKKMSPFHKMTVLLEKNREKYSNFAL